MELKTENFQFFFQQNAKLLRTNFGYSQMGLAAKLGFNYKSLQAIEEGRAIGIEKLYKYSNFFGVQINDLITRKIERKELKGLKLLEMA